MNAKLPFTVLIVFMLASAGRADIFTLVEGGKVEGDVIEEKDETLRVRTTFGIVDIEKDRIAKREASLTPWAEYDRQKAATPKTAAGYHALAQWCRKHGLPNEQRENLERVIKLDPNHKAARTALGYKKKDGKWARPQKRSAPKLTPAEKEAQHRAREEDKAVRKIISEYFIKVRAIYRGRLAGDEVVAASEKFRDGRRQILEIDDPLAIPALTRILTEGNAATRSLLVEALSQFTVDEATMNLVVVALLDPAPPIRAAAAEALDKRKDDRIVAELRSALAGDEEFIIRHAATALGTLKAKAAVPDLISVLSVETVQPVRVCLPVFLDDIYDTWGGWSQYRCGSRVLWHQPQYIGVIGPTYPMGEVFYTEYQVVSIHRTEVQEALIAITGKNLGFDEAAWKAWWRENK